MCTACRGGTEPSRRFGALNIDIAARRAVLGSKSLNLTRIEFEILAMLSSRPGVVFTNRQLLEGSGRILWWLHGPRWCSYRSPAPQTREDPPAALCDHSPRPWIPVRALTPLNCLSRSVGAAGRCPSAPAPFGDAPQRKVAQARCPRPGQPRFDLLARRRRADVPVPSTASCCSGAGWIGPPTRQHRL